jgi:peptidoglycan-N-acetylglucosamine deacetylase
MVHRTPFFLPLLYPSLVWRIPSHTRTLYLTFDDGPVAGPTDFVVETLRNTRTKGTFFCIGDNVRKHPSIFRSVLCDGHAIGNHTYNHLNGWTTTADRYEQNVSGCDDEIAAHTDGQISSVTTLFRPPFGRIQRSQIRRLIPRYKIIMWDVLSIDYNKNLSCEKCLRNTIDAARDGSIIVFHDSYKAEKNLRYVLPRFVEHCLDKGFTFKALS